MLDVLRVEEGEPLKLCLVQVHEEQLVGGGEGGGFGGELRVEVGHVFAVFLGGGWEWR